MFQLLLKQLTKKFHFAFSFLLSLLLTSFFFSNVSKPQISLSYTWKLEDRVELKESLSYFPKITQINFMLPLHLVFGIPCCCINTDGSLQ